MLSDLEWSIVVAVSEICPKLETLVLSICDKIVSAKVTANFKDPTAIKEEKAAAKKKAAAKVTVNCRRYYNVLF